MPKTIFRFVALALLIIQPTGAAFGQITVDMTDPWGCPAFDSCVGRPDGNDLPDWTADATKFVDILNSGGGTSGVSESTPLAQFDDPAFDIQLPGVWSYISSVPAGRGLKVNGSEFNIVNNLNNPPTSELGNTFNEVIDQAGNKHTYMGYSFISYALSPRMLQVEYAGGGKMVYSYDGRGNIIEREFTSTDDNTVLTSETHFSTDCLNILTCNKPEWTKDVSGNQTDFEYDPVHGNLVRETGPAVNGVRPETRYQYGQRYTWLKGSGSAYVKSADPIWVLESESYCRTSNYANGACAAGASDQVVTTYDYGPDSGPNNLWLRGTAVTSEGVTLRSCITYDDFGNVIAETSPNANQSSCS